MKTLKKLFPALLAALILLACTACRKSAAPKTLEALDGGTPELGRLVQIEAPVRVDGLRLSNEDILNVPFRNVGVNAEFALGEWIEMNVKYEYSGQGGKLGIWLFPHRDIAEYGALDEMKNNAYFCEYELPYETYPAPLEDGFELEIGAHGNKRPWTFEVDQKPSDKELADAAMYPSFVLEFDNGECKAAFGRWKDIYKRKTVEWTTRPHPGGKVKVVLVYKDGKATAFVGDDEKPIIENDEHAELLRSIKAGKLRFTGTYVRLFSAKVSRP